MSRAFVQKWITRFREVKNVDDFKRSGRKRGTTKKEDKAVVDLFKNNTDMTLHAARSKLLEKGIDLSISTIKRRLDESGLQYKATIQKPLLNEITIEKRVKFADNNIDRDWTKVIYTDESSFSIFNKPSCAWAQRGTRCVVRTVKHPLKVHVYGALSSRGFGKLVCFTGILNASRMVKIYQKGLLRSAEILFGKNNNDWVLLEDNDPKHKSALCQEWKRQKNIKSLDWPPQSPDLNPIENVWGLMKTKLRAKKIENTKQLVRHLKKYGMILVMTMH